MTDKKTCLVKYLDYNESSILAGFYHLHQDGYSKLLSGIRSKVGSESVAGESVLSAAGAAVSS